MKVYHRYLIWLVFILGLIGSLGSFFAQYVLHLNPCPMCIFQRVAVIGTALFSLPFLWHPIATKWIRRVVSIFIGMPACFGLGVAIQQIHLQSLPADKVPACGPGLSFLVDTLPLSQVISVVLSGSGECAQVERILGVPLPLWSAVLFSVVLLLLLLSLFVRNKS